MMNSVKCLSRKERYSLSSQLRQQSEIQLKEFSWSFSSFYEAIHPRTSSQLSTFAGGISYAFIYWSPNVILNLTSVKLSRFFLFYVPYEVYKVKVKSELAFHVRFTMTSAWNFVNTVKRKCVSVMLESSSCWFSPSEVGCLGVLANFELNTGQTNDNSFGLFQCVWREFSCSGNNNILQGD